MTVVDLILYLIAFAAFLVAALFTDTVRGRVNLVALGLAAWVLVPLIDAFPH